MEEIQKNFDKERIIKDEELKGKNRQQNNLSETINVESNN